LYTEKQMHHSIMDE